MYKSCIDLEIDKNDKNWAVDKDLNINKIQEYVSTKFSKPKLKKVTVRTKYSCGPDGFPIPVDVQGMKEELKPFEKNQGINMDIEELSLQKNRNVREKSVDSQSKMIELKPTENLQNQDVSSKNLKEVSIREINFKLTNLVHKNLEQKDLGLELEVVKE